MDETIDYQKAEAILREMASALTAAGHTLDQHELPAWIGGVKTSEPYDGGEVSVAELKRRLRRAEMRYRALVEQIPAVTFMASLDQSVSELFVSPHIETLLGFTQQEWLEDPFLWYRQLHPDDRVRWQKEFARTCATGVDFRSDYRFLARDGHTVWVRGEATIVRDVDGRPLFLQGIAFDITEIKDAEQQLKLINQTLEWQVAERTEELAQINEQLTVEIEQRQRAEDRFRATVESAPTAMVMVDRQGEMVLVNAETERLFGYSRDELLGRPVEIIVPERFRAGHPQMRDGFFANPEARLMGAGRDLFALRKDGSEFPVEIGLNPIETEEGMFVLSAIVDITERKQAERQIRQYAAELKRSNTELDQFAYSASHDLRAPLRAVDRLASWIVEDHANELPKQVCHDLDLMRRRIKRMDRLLDDLLQYSRVGRTDGDLDTIDCGALVRDVVDLLAPPAGFTIEIGPLPTITTHRTPLEQVFRNLIGNTVKHHDREDGRIEVAAKHNGSHVEFTVRDDGPGIPAAFHDQVFGMFQTLQSRDKVEGSGMGLALVKKIVESRGGKIRLDSAEGTGAKFCFTWLL